MTYDYIDDQRSLGRPYKTAALSGLRPSVRPSVHFVHRHTMSFIFAVAAVLSGIVSISAAVGSFYSPVASYHGTGVPSGYVVPGSYVASPYDASYHGSSTSGRYYGRGGGGRDNNKYAQTDQQSYDTQDDTKYYYGGKFKG